MEEGVEQNNNTDDQNIPQIELEWNCLKNSIACGRSTLPTKKKLVNQPWMKNKILDLMKERKSKPRMSNKYKTINKEIDPKCQEAREEWLVAKCKKIEQLSRTHQTNHMYKEIRSFTKKQNSCKSGCIRSKDRSTYLLEKADITKRWEEYLKICLRMIEA